MCGLLGSCEDLEVEDGGRPHEPDDQTEEQHRLRGPFRGRADSVAIDGPTPPEFHATQVSAEHEGAPEENRHLSWGEKTGSEDRHLDAEQQVLQIEGAELQKIERHEDPEQRIPIVKTAQQENGRRADREQDGHIDDESELGIVHN